MEAFAIAFSRALLPALSAAELAEAVEAALGGPDRVAGGCVLATAAAGAQGVEVGMSLAERWPAAELSGTQFEGLIAEGRVWRDEPALGLLAWGSGALEPMALAFEAGDIEATRLAHEILDSTGRDRLGPNDLVLLFPDAHCVSPIEPMLPSLASALGTASIAGSAASGIDGAPALTWMGSQIHPGGLLALIVPGPESGPAPAEPVAPADPVVEETSRVRTARASRAATPWLQVTSGRSRWVDGLEGELALVRVRRELGLASRAPLEGFLSRLLVRMRSRSAPALAPAPARTEEEIEAQIEDERFVIGIDERRGGFSLPMAITRGREIALAWPDAERGRDALRQALAALAPSPWILQLACRARGAELHGDADLEPAWVAAHAGGRVALGTVAPFQIGPDARGEVRLLVHSTVLAALTVD